MGDKVGGRVGGGAWGGQGHSQPEPPRRNTAARSMEEETVVQGTRDKTRR